MSKTVSLKREFKPKIDDNRVQDAMQKIKEAVDRLLNCDAANTSFESDGSPQQFNSNILEGPPTSGRQGARLTLGPLRPRVRRVEVSLEDNVNSARSFGSFQQRTQSDYMPRIKDIPGPYWLFFYSFDGTEPIHADVRRDHQTCKFWLEPIQLAANQGFNARELRVIRRLIEFHRDTITEAWHEHVG